MWSYRARRSTAAMVSDPLTLVIALDANSAATGDLYLDDGRSYAFQRGYYTYRTFTFTPDGTLTNRGSGLEAGGMPTPDPTYDPETVIDRVAIVGLAGGPAGWTAQLVKADGSEVALEAGPGPMLVQSAAPELALVVRRPRLPAGKEWTVRFTKSVASGTVSK